MERWEWFAAGICTGIGLMTLVLEISFHLVHGG